MNRILATTRGTVEIRRAREDDAERFRELRLEALKDSPTAFGADYDSNAAQPPEYWRERVGSTEEKTLYLADHDGALLGMTGIIRNSSRKTRHNAWLWGVYVTPVWRGMRVADELIEACVGWAETGGIVIIKLGVAAINSRAIRCYERCGFSIYGTEPRALFYEDVYYDEYLMARQLDDK